MVVTRLGLLFLNTSSVKSMNKYEEYGDPILQPIDLRLI